MKRKWEGIKYCNPDTFVSIRQNLESNPESILRIQKGLKSVFIWFKKCQYSISTWLLQEWKRPTLPNISPNYSLPSHTHSASFHILISCIRTSVWLYLFMLWIRGHAFPYHLNTNNVISFSADISSWYSQKSNVVSAFP